MEIIYYNNGNPCWIKFYVNGDMLEIRGYSRDGLLTSIRVQKKKARDAWLKSLEYEENQGTPSDPPSTN